MELTQEQKDALLKYEDLKIQAKLLEAEMDELKPIVLSAVPEGTKVNATEGVFEVKKRDNWTFSPEIKAKEDNLKAEKEAAIAKGEATSKPTFYIEYRKNKKTSIDSPEE